MTQILHETSFAAVAPFDRLTSSDLLDLDTNARAMVWGSYYSTTDENGTTIISFSFPSSSSQFTSYGAGSEPYVGFSELSESEKEHIRETLAFVESVANIRFVEVQDSGAQAGTLRFAWTEAPNPYGSVGSVGWSYFPDNSTQAGDVWLRSTTLSSEGFAGVSVHELGHALGLKHPFAFPFTLPAHLDVLDYTVMTNVWSLEYPNVTYMDLVPKAFMWLDVQGLQALYGTNETHANGNTTYDFNTGRHFTMIWDTGGVDTVDVSEVTRGVNINLTPNSWIDVGSAVGHYASGQFIGAKTDTVYLPPSVVLERIFAGSGDDSLTGNNADNVIRGGDGNDKIEGGNGADLLRGDAGHDTVHGGTGDDTIWAGGSDAGDDLLFGDEGRDIIGGGAGNDLIAGGTHGDVLFGGDGNDTLISTSWEDVNNDGIVSLDEIANTSFSESAWAGGGDDLIFASSGNDILGGGAGDDTIVGGNGDDTLYGGNDAGDQGTNDSLLGGEGDDKIFSGAGNDNVDAGTGDDTVFGGSGNDNIAGATGNDLIFNGGGEDTVHGGCGDDTIWGGAGDDLLTGGAGKDFFVFGKRNGVDTIADFDPLEDLLNLQYADFENLEDLLSSAVESTEGVTVTFSETTLHINGITLADLTETNVAL